jgi:hypothetical protein
MNHMKFQKILFVVKQGMCYKNCDGFPNPSSRFYLLLGFDSSLQHHPDTGRQTDVCRGGRGCLGGGQPLFP